MKANAPKRKVFQDALDLLAEDPVKNTPVPVNGIVSIPVEEIHSFHDHPFRLYEGERLEDMVQSIKDHGVLNPVIVRKAARGYEMLAGHNRTNAAKIAGLTEVPAIVKTDLSDEDAYVYVIETNLLQRSFAELLPSEKAAVLVARYEKISSQGKRNDIRQEIERLEKATIGGTPKVQELLAKYESTPLKSGTTLAELIKRPELDYEKLAEVDEKRPELAFDVQEQVNIEIKYEGYIKRQMQQVAQFKKLEGRKLPENFDYAQVNSLRKEAVQKLNKIQPSTIGQASRISGVSPADISVLMVYLERSKSEA